MSSCNATLPDGKPCPNEADEGQKYCPFHLANQDAMVKKTILSIGGIVLGALGIATVESIASSKRE